MDLVTGTAKGKLGVSAKVYAGSSLTAELYGWPASDNLDRVEQTMYTLRTDLSKYITVQESCAYFRQCLRL